MTAKTEWLQVRATTEEKQAWAAYAATKKKTMSQIVCDIMNRLSKYDRQKSKKTY